MLEENKSLQGFMMEMICWDSYCFSSIMVICLLKILETDDSLVGQETSTL